MQIRIGGLWPREGLGGLLSVMAGAGAVGRAGDDPTGLPDGFRAHYDAVLRPRIAVFEERRRAALASLRRRLWIFVPAAGGVAALGGYLLSIAAVDIGLLATAGGLLLLWWWTYAPALGYRRAVKGEIYPDIFRYFGESFVYRETGPLSAKSLAPSGIIPGHDDERREDYVAGVYKGVGLELTETVLTEERRRGKNSQTVTVFRGILILLEMNKRFGGRTVVVQDAGRLMNWLADRISALDRVTLEDPVFEDRFEVYSTDQIEARYLLTPSFMERLLTLGRLFGGGNIRCAFFDDRLLFAIDSRDDRFESGSILEPETFADEIATIVAEMAVIFEIIDILRLDERTRL